MTYSYWWPFLWVLLAGALSLFFDVTRTEPDLEGRIVVRWRWLPAILLMVPIVLLTMYRPLPFGDSGAYKWLFDSAPSSLSSFSSYIESQEKDPGYAVLQIVFKALISRNYLLFFLFIALVQTICILIAFRKCSTDYWLSIFFFVASCFIVLKVKNILNIIIIYLFIIV